MGFIAVVAVITTPTTKRKKGGGLVTTKRRADMYTTVHARTRRDQSGLRVHVRNIIATSICSSIASSTRQNCAFLAPPAHSAPYRLFLIQLTCQSIRASHQAVAEVTSWGRESIAQRLGAQHIRFQHVADIGDLKSKDGLGGGRRRGGGSSCEERSRRCPFSVFHTAHTPLLALPPPPSLALSSPSLFVPYLANGGILLFKLLCTAPPLPNRPNNSCEHRRPSGNSQRAVKRTLQLRLVTANSIHQRLLRHGNAHCSQSSREQRLRCG